MKNEEWEEEIPHRIYNALQGFQHFIIEQEWVENLFQPGKPLYQSYANMREAYDHLLERLNETDEDQDVELIIDCFMDYGRILGLEMFKYGRKYQKMIDEGKYK